MLLLDPIKNKKAKMLTIPRMSFKMQALWTHCCTLESSKGQVQFWTLCAKHCAYQAVSAYTDQSVVSWIQACRTAQVGMAAPGSATAGQQVAEAKSIQISGLIAAGPDNLK
jgi:hypothetical protein